LSTKNGILVDESPEQVGDDGEKDGGGGLNRGEAEFVTFEGGGEGGKGGTTRGDGLEEVLHKGLVRTGVEGKAGKVGIVFLKDDLPPSTTEICPPSASRVPFVPMMEVVRPSCMDVPSRCICRRTSVERTASTSWVS
jgi:hypothetical protein